jgi:hypothetical protein
MCSPRSTSSSSGSWRAAAPSAGWAEAAAAARP